MLVRPKPAARRRHQGFFPRNSGLAHGRNCSATVPTPIVRWSNAVLGDRAGTGINIPVAPQWGCRRIAVVHTVWTSL